MEMHQITLALETYRNEFGEYPPDLSDANAVVRHVKKRWPRFNLPGTTNADKYTALILAINNVYRNSVKTNFVKNYVSTASATSNYFHPEAKHIGAIAFWLGGFPSENMDGSFGGFAADPQAPFGRDTSLNNIPNDGNPDTTNYDWDPDNIVLGTLDKKVFFEMKLGKNTYFASSNSAIFVTLVSHINSSSLPVPYVYFRGRGDGGPTSYIFEDSTDNEFYVKSYNFGDYFSDDWHSIGVAIPYASSGGDPFNPTLANRTIVSWHEDKRFQLIHPGLDGHFGNLGTNNVIIPFHDEYFKTTKDAVTNNIGQKDFDNLTNFSDYQQIKSILP
jgi:hypothetical protein